MTNAQKRAIARIDDLVRKEFYNDKYEIKERKIDENEYFVSMIIEWGLKNDEGTMAAIFARDRAHLFIGRKGGITYPVYKNGDSTCRRFSGITILQALCDQRL